MPADIGWDYWVREGDALPERTIELLEKHKLGTVRGDHLEAEEGGRSRTVAGPARKRVRLFQPDREDAAAFRSGYLHPPLPLVSRQPAELRPPQRRGDRGAEDRRRHLPAEHRGALLGRRMDQSAQAGPRRAGNPSANEELRRRRGPRPGRLLPHPHPRGLPADHPRRLRLCQEVRLQVGHDLRKAERHPRNLGHDGGGSQADRRRLSGHQALVDQYRRPNDVADEEPRGLRRPGGQQHVRRHHFRRFRRAGGRAGLRGQRQHRPRGGRLRADPRLGPEIRRPAAVDRQPDRHDPGRLR